MNENLHVIKQYIDAKKYNQALAVIKKAHKKSIVNEQNIFDYVYVECVCYLNTNKTELAERLVLNTRNEIDMAKKVHLLNLIANTLINNNEQVDLRKIKAVLEKSVGLDDTIKNGSAILMLYKLYVSMYDLEAAEKIWIKLSKWQNYYESAVLERLEFARKLDIPTIINDCLNNLIKNKLSISSQSYFTLIYNLIISNRKDEARVLLSESKQGFDVTDNKIYLESTLHFECGDIDRSKTLIKTIKQPDSKTCNLLAKLEEKSNSFRKAFESYTRAAELENNRLQTVYPNVIEDYRKLNLTKVTKNINKVYFNPDIRSSKELILNNKHVDLCFMVGFPRSGTTLLENILDSQKEVLTLPELGLVNRSYRYYETITKKQYPIGLEYLKTGHINLLKENYISTLINVIESKKINNEDPKAVFEHSMVIDKMPLSSIHLPFINTMFPNSKIIFSLRHPLDVVLSNFQQYYSMNKEMSFLVTLEGCVNRYIEVMNHVLNCENSLQLKILYVKYEDIVNNFDFEAQRTFEFLGINYRNTYKDFHKLAAKKSIRTPSRTQVSKQIYSSSTMKWKHYEEYLKPYFERLMPYITRFGYEV